MAWRLEGMTTARLTFTIYQGATFDESLDRVSYPYPIRQECGQIVKECGSPAPDADAASVTVLDAPGFTVTGSGSANRIR